MHPVLIDTDVFQLHSYGAMGAIGFVVLCVLALREVRARGWPTDAVVDVIFWTAIAGIAGSRLFFLVQNPEVIRTPGPDDGWIATLPGMLFDAVNLRAGGLVFYGAFAGLPVGVWLAWTRGLAVLPLADVFGRLLPLAHGLSRVGCFLAGCCYGRPTDLPWSVVFTDPRSIAPPNVHLHPVQLYEAAGLFAISAALTVFAPHKRFDGQVLLLYLLSYATLRATTETFRGDTERGFVLEAWLGTWVSTSQLIAALFMVGCAVAWAALSRRASTSTSPPPPGGDGP